MKKYLCYSLKLAKELNSKGFEIVDTGINIKFPKYKVFFFEDTEELRKTIEEISAR